MKKGVDKKSLQLAMKDLETVGLVKVGEGKIDKEKIKRQIAKSFEDFNNFLINFNPNKKEGLHVMSKDKLPSGLQNYEDTERLEALGIKRNPKFRANFFKLNNYLVELINRLDKFQLTSTQLRVLSYVNMQSELDRGGEALTITTIADGLNQNFTTVQRCVEKLGPGYSYNRGGKVQTTEGAGLIKYQKLQGNREGSVSISPTGKKFLEGLAELTATYGGSSASPFLETTFAVMNMQKKFQQLQALGNITKLGMDMGLFDDVLNFKRGKEK